MDEEGVVLVERYGVWGTVCASMYHRDHMRLLCQHLGYDDGEYMPKENTPARYCAVPVILNSLTSDRYCTLPISLNNPTPDRYCTLPISLRKTPQTGTVLSPSA